MQKELNNPSISFYSQALLNIKNYFNSPRSAHSLYNFKETANNSMLSVNVDDTLSISWREKLRQFATIRTYNFHLFNSIDFDPSDSSNAVSAFTPSHDNTLQSINFEEATKQFSIIDYRDTIDNKDETSDLPMLNNNTPETLIDDLGSFLGSDQSLEAEIDSLENTINKTIIAKKKKKQRKIAKKMRKKFSV